MKIEKSTRYERLETAGEASRFWEYDSCKDGAYKDIKALLLSFLQ